MSDKLLDYRSDEAMRLLRTIAAADGPIRLRLISKPNGGASFYALAKRGYVTREIRRHKCDLQVWTAIADAGRQALMAADRSRMDRMHAIAIRKTQRHTASDIISTALARHPGATLRELGNGSIRTRCITMARRDAIVALAEAFPHWSTIKIAQTIGLHNTTALYALRKHLNPGYTNAARRQWHRGDARAIVAARAATAASDAPTQAP